jgi:hypothetical protein
MRQWLALFESVLDNPAFRRWFGHSRVVNQDGSPRVCFHGTGEHFTAFDTDRDPINYETDRGKIFFTSDESVAKDYAENVCAWGSKPSANPRVIAAYVSLQNPYVIDNSDSPIEDWDQWGDLYGREAAEEGADGIIIHTENGSEWLVVAFSANQVKLIDNQTCDPDSPEMDK